MKNLAGIAEVAGVFLLAMAAVGSVLFLGVFLALPNAQNSVLAFGMTLLIVPLFHTVSRRHQYYAWSVVSSLGALVIALALRMVLNYSFQVLTIVPMIGLMIEVSWCYLSDFADKVIALFKEVQSGNN